jgi:hypothetical protein
MSLYLRSMVRILLGAWVVCTALAQPGLPACWLEKQACQVHHHFSKSHSETPHTHEYLSDLVKATSTQGSPVLDHAISLLIALRFTILLLRGTANHSPSNRLWLAPPEPPPPRFAFST